MKGSGKIAAKTTKSGQAIIRSLKEIRAWQRGKGRVRVVEVSDPIHLCA